jgi:hypothetical protein
METYGMPAVGVKPVVIELLPHLLMILEHNSTNRTMLRTWSEVQETVLNRVSAIQGMCRGVQETCTLEAVLEQDIGCLLHQLVVFLRSLLLT